MNKKYLAIISTSILLLVGFYAGDVKTNKIFPPTERNIISESQKSNGNLELFIQPEAGIEPIINLIKKSQKSIDLVMYEFTDKDIGDALVEAQKRGVNVRVLMNKKFFNKKESPNLPAYKYLNDNGVSAHWAPNYFALTHQKTFIFDSQKALIMTFNLMPRYYTTGRDFGILNANPNDVQAIQETFEADWANKKIANINGDDLVWSPGSEKDMLLIINNAKKSLKIYNQEMADQKITDAIIEASKRGVDVKVVMSYSSNWRSAFAQLRKNGVKIHTYEGSKSLYIHAKMILADDTYAFLGSENFSVPSLEKNRELGMFISDPNIISQILQTFIKDYSNGKEF